MISKILFAASMFAVLSFAIPKAHAWSFGDPKHHTAIIISNSNSYSTDGAALQQDTVLFTFFEFLEGHEKSSRKNDSVTVYFTADPDDLVFSGTVPEFYGAASDVFGKSQIQNRCNDLGMIYDQLERYVVMNDVEHLSIIHIGGFLSVDVTCTDETEVYVPQEVEKTLALAPVLRQMKSGSFSARLVRDEQEGELYAYLQTGGVTDLKKIEIDIVRTNEMAKIIAQKKRNDGREN